MHINISRVWKVFYVCSRIEAACENQGRLDITQIVRKWLFENVMENQNMCLHDDWPKLCLKYLF